MHAVPASGGLVPAERDQSDPRAERQLRGAASHTTCGFPGHLSALFLFSIFFLMFSREIFYDFRSVYHISPNGGSKHKFNILK